MKTFGLLLIFFIFATGLLGSLLLDEVHWRERLQAQVSRQSLQVSRLQGEAAWYNAPDPVIFYKHYALSSAAFNAEHHIKSVVVTSAVDENGINKQIVNIVYLPGFGDKSRTAK